MVLDRMNTFVCTDTVVRGMGKREVMAMAGFGGQVASCKAGQFVLLWKTAEEAKLLGSTRTR